MSNIRFEKCSDPVYKKILLDKIRKVCKKIGFDDSKIRWVIYKPNKYEIKLNTNLLSYDFGFCILEKNEIWISTLAIEKERSNLTCEKSCVFPPKNESDSLENILIDEITHIQTRCDHGNPIYDNKHKENIQKYYQKGINSISWKYPFIKIFEHVKFFQK